MLAPLSFCCASCSLALSVCSHTCRLLLILPLTLSCCERIRGVVTPLMLVPMGLVGILYAKTMGKFRPAARDLKRSESKSRSPIYTHFREALKGVETIRTFPGSRNRWEMKHQRLTDDNLSVFYSIKALDRWLSVRLETLGNIVVFAAAVASIFLSRAGALKAGRAGWALTQSLSITGLLVCFLLWMVPLYLPTSF